MPNSPQASSTSSTSPPDHEQRRDPAGPDRGRRRPRVGVPVRPDAVRRRPRRQGRVLRRRPRRHDRRSRHPPRRRRDDRCRRTSGGGGRAQLGPDRSAQRRWPGPMHRRRPGGDRRPTGDVRRPRVGRHLQDDRRRRDLVPAVARRAIAVDGCHRHRSQPPGDRVGRHRRIVDRRRREHSTVGSVEKHRLGGDVGESDRHRRVRLIAGRGTRR